jgi:hypothetical protein
MRLVGFDGNFRRRVGERRQVDDPDQFAAVGTGQVRVGHFSALLIADP